MASDDRLPAMPWCPMTRLEDKCVGDACAWCVGWDSRVLPVCALRNVADKRALPEPKSRVLEFRKLCEEADSADETTYPHSG